MHFYFNFKEDSDSFDSETGDPPGLIPAGDVEDSDMSEVSGFLEYHHIRLDSCLRTTAKQQATMEAEKAKLRRTWL